MFQIQQKVVEFLTEAHNHSKNLYTWRSLMRLFVHKRQNLTDKSEESKAALRACIHVMDKEIRKMTDLHKFNKDAAKFLAQEITKFSQTLSTDKQVRQQSSNKSE